MNDRENARPFKTPLKAYIKHKPDTNLVIIARALNTIEPAYMCRDSAAWLDNEGMVRLLILPYQAML